MSTIGLQTALSSAEYNLLWENMDDFIRFNPGARHRRRLMEKCLPDASPKNVLDLGCGPGEMLIKVMSRYPAGTSFTGVDLSDYVIERNQKLIRNAKFQVFDFEKDSVTALGSTTYDLIICSEVIEHLKDPEEAVKKMSRMVAARGTLILTFPLGKVFPTEIHVGHTIHPDLEGIIDAARVEGLEVQKLFKWGFPFYWATKIAANISPEWSIKSFATGRYDFKKRLVNRLIYWANFFNSSRGMGCQAVISFQKK